MPGCIRRAATVIERGQTRCCYAKSEKSWIDDPAGISWETFLTSGESTDYGDGTGEREARVAHAKAVLRAGRGAVAEPAVVRLPDTALNVIAVADRTVQCALSMHRQFRSLHHG